MTSSGKNEVNNWIKKMSYKYKEGCLNRSKEAVPKWNLIEKGKILSQELIIKKNILEREKYWVEIKKILVN